MENILKIEKEICVIREDIESTEGSLHYLNNQVGYSTLNITYHEKKATAGFHFGNKISEALSDGSVGFLWVLIGLAQLWHRWLIHAIIWYDIYKVAKPRKNVNLNQKTNQ